MSEEAPGRFPVTRWSRLIGKEGEDARRPDLEHLAQHYWKPVFAYVRVKFNKKPEEALDLTQEFFLWMLEGDFLRRATPERGRFRAFLKVSLAHFLTDKERRKRAQKRGGDRKFVPLEFESDPSTEIHASKDLGPEAALDASWRSEVLRRATARLEEELQGSGRGDVFAVFRDYFLDPEDEVDYRKLAEKHGINEIAVHNWLAKAKKLYRRQLRQEVLETVSNPEELEQELTWLFGEEGR